MFERNTPTRERKRVRVTILRARGAPFSGFVFVDRGERIVDLMNDDRAFIPVESLTGAISVIQKSDICEIAPHEKGRAPILSAIDDPYALLGVGRQADPREIRSAYHKILKALHPDTVRAAGLHDYFISAANDISARLVAAYDEIKAEQARDQAA